MSSFPLIMISAMYENGGNTTHRMLDGHPELFVYPFESQLGTSLVADHLTSFVPFKYRWPEFPLDGNPASDYELIFDEEMKVRLRTPQRSKFQSAALELDENERRNLFVKVVSGQERTRAALIEAFFRSTFESWRNRERTGREKAFVGYSPVLVLDTEKILADFRSGHVVHVVRNPYSGYADTKKRPFPLSLERYAWTWNLCQHMALVYAEKYPDRFHIVRFEDLVARPGAEMGKLCARLGLSESETCLYPSWNSKKLEHVYPWGTVRTPTTEANLATMQELSAEERMSMQALATVMMRLLGYAKL